MERKLKNLEAGMTGPGTALIRSKDDCHTIIEIKNIPDSNAREKMKQLVERSDRRRMTSSLASAFMALASFIGFLFGLGKWEAADALFSRPNLAGFVIMAFITAIMFGAAGVVVIINRKMIRLLLKRLWAKPFYHSITGYCKDCMDYEDLSDVICAADAIDDIMDTIKYGDILSASLDTAMLAYMGRLCVSVATADGNGDIHEEDKTVSGFHSLSNIILKKGQYQIDLKGMVVRYGTKEAGQ